MKPVNRSESRWCVRLKNFTTVNRYRFRTWAKRMAKNIRRKYNKLQEKNYDVD